MQHDEEHDAWGQLTRHTECLVCGNYCDEGALAYGLFLKYCNMPPENRSQKRVIADTIQNCQQEAPHIDESNCIGVQHTCRSKKLIIRIAKKYHWTDRASARDRSLAKCEEIATRKSLQKTAAKRAQAWSTFSDRVWDLSTRLLDKVSAILDLPITKQEITEMAGETFVDFETGQQRHEKIINITIHPVKTSPKDASQMLKDADTLARLAVGKETAIFGFDVNGIDQGVAKMARAALVKLRDEYAGDPAMLAALPDIVAKDWQVDKKLLLDASPESVMAEQNEQGSDAIN
jgi:hypothetical protein